MKVVSSRDYSQCLAAFGLVKRHGDLEEQAGVSFAVDAGEIVAVLGPNGSGKTTLIECLTFQQPVTAGEIELFGRFADRLSRGDRARIGVVAQNSQTDSELTAREHLTMIAGHHGEGESRVAALIERVGLGEASNRRVHKLSGGQRRKLEVAVALVGRPELLFLDEPTTGLDVETRSALWAAIREERDAGTAIVLTTHYLEEAEHLADRVDVLVDGRMVASAPPAELAGGASLTDAYSALVESARKELIVN